MTNKELIEYYTQYEEVLENAISLSFIHLTYGEFMDIVKYYEDMIGTPLKKSQLNCNSCRLKALKDLGYKLRELKTKNKTTKKKVNE